MLCPNCGWPSWELETPVNEEKNQKPPFLDLVPRKPGAGRLPYSLIPEILGQFEVGYHLSFL